MYKRFLIVSVTILTTVANAGAEVGRPYIPDGDTVLRQGCDARLWGAVPFTS